MSNSNITGYVEELIPSDVRPAIAKKYKQPDLSNILIISSLKFDPKTLIYSSVRIIASRILHEICLLIGELAI